MLFAPNSTLLMIGDSITDCGRSQPVGEGSGLGDGYVRQVDAMLGAWMPELRLRILNLGSSGHTVRDLAARWDRDVVGRRPDWVSIMIGTNDVWRQFDCPLRTETHVMPDEYRDTLERLTRDTQKAGAKTILMTPFFLEPLRQDAMRARMDEYGAIVKQIAATTASVFIDTQAAFDRVLEQTYSASIAWDRVHPNATGHMVIARAFLSAAGFVW